MNQQIWKHCVFISFPSIALSLLSCVLCSQIGLFTKTCKQTRNLIYVQTMRERWEVTHPMLCFLLTYLKLQVPRWWICLLQASTFYWVLWIYLWTLMGKMFWITAIWRCNDCSIQLHISDWGEGEGVIGSVGNKS